MPHWIDTPAALAAHLQRRPTRIGLDTEFVRERTFWPQLALVQIALDDDVHQVTVVAVGRARVIAPVGESWDSWFDGPGVSPDFMAERDQPAMQEREAL